MSEPGVVFITDGAVMADMLHGPNGMVMRSLIERATRVQLAARRQVQSTTRGTGRLASGIVKRPQSQGVNPLVQVGVWTVPYAIFVHEGTKPHDIPNAFGYGPHFGIGGRFDGKFHPGTKPNRFLTDNMALAID